MVSVGEDKPAWLEKLMEETFFTGCGVHPNRRKNDKNILCLTCCITFCPHCLPSHPNSHPLLQVRRYVYHDVVRLVDLQKLIDCSFIQPYTINGAKVIFVKQRTQSSSRGTPNACFTCDRILQPPYHFCSLSCKVDHMVCQGEGMTSVLVEAPDSATQPHHHHNNNHHLFVPDSLSQPDQYSHINVNPSSSTADTQHKDGDTSVATSPFLTVFSLNNRRKGAPHRAPLS